VSDSRRACWAAERIVDRRSCWLQDPRSSPSPTLVAEIAPAGTITTNTMMARRPPRQRAACGLSARTGQGLQPSPPWSEHAPLKPPEWLHSPSVHCTM
jgi:hypothetical protein